MFWFEFLPAFVIAFIVYLFMCVGTSPVECLTSKKILDIGGCDRYAECRVRYEDGSTGYAKAPLIGENICLSSVTHFKYLGFK